MDYDKTLQFTIEQLENQLADLKNQAETTENEKTSDNNSAVTVNGVSPEIVSENGFKAFWDEFYPIIILLAICIVFLIIGIYVFANENNIEISIPKASEQQIVDYELTIVPEIGSISIYSSEQGTDLYLNSKEQEQPQELQKTEQEQSEINIFQYCKNFALRFLPIIITIFCTKFAIGFLMKVMRGV